MFLDHATPAAFYCHQESRSNYYDIGLELIGSGFDYSAGDGLLKPTGDEKKSEGPVRAGEGSRLRRCNDTG